MKPTADPSATRAVIYLRVSSRGQLTDYDEDGLSIAGQQEYCGRKAADLGATIVGEYVERAESAKTDERPALRQMLARIREQRDVDYVIVWKVDRFARNRRDDANMVFEIEMSGAKLVSATENIDDTPAGRLMHGMLASFSEYYSRNLAAEVVKGATQKAKRGGTPGMAPLGYTNVIERLDGRDVRTVALDSTRSTISSSYWKHGGFAAAAIVGSPHAHSTTPRSTHSSPTTTTSAS
jgi:site-specific DNA recombinase